jgi:hypothetical protein
MSRKEIYNKIKELGIAKEIESRFGQNFTRVSSASLEEFLRGYATVKKVIRKPVVPNYEKVIIRLVSTLQAKKYLTAAEAEDVLKLL